MPSTRRDPHHRFPSAALAISEEERIEICNISAWYEIPDYQLPMTGKHITHNHVSAFAAITFFPVESRGRAIGIWGGVLGLGGVLGPILGAGIVQEFGWSWIFWVNVPIAVALIPSGLRFITETFGARQPLDVLGLVLESTGFLASSGAWCRPPPTRSARPTSSRRPPSGSSWWRASCSGRAGSPHPMLPLTIFRNSRFSIANTVSFGIYGSLTGSVFRMSQYF